MKFTKLEQVRGKQIFFFTPEVRLIQHTTD